MKRTPEQIKEFIRINHMYYTALEIAEELNINPSLVSFYCKTLEIKLMGKSESNLLKVKELIGKFTISEISERLSLGIPYLKDLCKKNNLAYINIDGRRIKVKKKKEPEKEEKKPQYEPHDVGMRPGTKGFKDKYNQTGSEILDSLRGIETTKRVGTVNRISFAIK